MRHIISSLIEDLASNTPCIIASINSSSGSTPRSTGARMLVRKDGSITGSVGGGAIEGRCIASAMDLFKSNSNDQICNFDLSPNDAASLGMVCGGAVSVLLQKGKVSDLDLFRKLYGDYKMGNRPVLLTHLPIKNVEAYFSLLNDEADNVKNSIAFSLGQQKKLAPLLISANNKQILTETLVHPGTVHLMGAGHVALATAKAAHLCHFEVVVVDDREEFANESRYPQAREIKVLNNFENCFNELTPDDYVVIVTRGHLHDRDVLAEALQTKAGYIGMIGSKRKIQAVYESLLQVGFTQEELERVHSPIGLNIGADSPEEIAISIVAELIQKRAAK